MSVEFRPRKLGEYANILRKRKWLVLLPAIVIGLAIGYVVFRLPDMYESVTLIVVKPSTLPNSVVPTITEETLTRELTSISQVVTSRSSLQPLMEKYDLYKEERQRGEPMELLIDQMRKQIKVEVNTSRNDITNGFNITYRGRDPKATQAVAAELASKYIDEQTKGTINAGASAKQFIEEQVRTAKEELDTIDTQRLKYLQENMNNLPSQSQALVGRLTALHEGQKAMISELGRSRDLGAAYRSQLADITKSQNYDGLGQPGQPSIRTRRRLAEPVDPVQSKAPGRISEKVTAGIGQARSGPNDRRLENTDRRAATAVDPVERPAPADP
jgi:capsular polysaccharide biosynthesis protein